jgi:hypothetical protein
MRIFLIFLITLFSLSCTSGNSAFEKKVEDRFIGKWLFHSSEDGKGDGSMDGLVATIKKVEGTNETYMFLYIKFALMFSRKDERTLIGVDNKFSLKYDESTQHLIFNIGKGNFNKFTNLK